MSALPSIVLVLFVFGGALVWLGLGLMAEKPPEHHEEPES